MEEQDKLVLRDYKSVSGLQLQDSWTVAEFSWAWFTVNTRAVYLEHDPRYESHLSSYESHLPSYESHLSRYESQSQLPSQDRLALVPYLDLLNHSGSVSVRVAVSHRHYQVVSLSPVQKYQQAFISYGPHDNTKLLVEYGFYLKENPHESFNISTGDVLQFVETTGFVCPDIDRKIEMIRDNDLHLKLCIVEEGFTWSLKTVLKILTFRIGESSNSLIEKAYNDEEDEKYERLFLAFLSYLTERLTKEKIQMKNVLLNCSDQFVECYNLVESHLGLLERARAALV